MRLWLLRMLSIPLSCLQLDRYINPSWSEPTEHLESCFYLRSGKFLRFDSCSHPASVPHFSWKPIFGVLSWLFLHNPLCIVLISCYSMMLLSPFQLRPFCDSVIPCSYPWKALISLMIFLAKSILADVFSLTLSLHFLNSFKYLTIFPGPNIYIKTQVMQPLSVLLLPSTKQLSSFISETICLIW